MKKALVLSGGAALGAFQAGFLYRDRVKYDLICGVSAGALNGAMIAQDKHEEMKELWSKFAIDRQNIYSSKVLSPTGKIKPIALLWESITSWPLVSVAENLPLKNLINTYMVKDDFKTKLIIGATSLNTFTYYPITSDSVDEENLHKLLLASAAFPGVFPPVKSWPQRNTTDYWHRTHTITNSPSLRSLKCIFGSGSESRGLVSTG